VFKLVLREIDRLESLIRDLLVYARPSKPNLERVPVEPIVETILQMLEARIKQKRIQVDLKGLENLEVYADRRQLHQILFNLMVNSIQAIKPENGYLLIEAKVLEETIELTVQDNGIGIDTSEQQKIFTPFFTTKDKGTGLGLAISRRMMEDLEGSIRFESIPGEITRFILTFSKGKPNKTLDFPTKPLT
jgi:two-component system sensor histidine kinase AtoS